MTPVATYRLQLHEKFTFDDAAGLADYFSGLGVSHLYLSPVMESAPHSAHGYDCMDFSKISAERGGENGFHRLMETLGRQEPPLRVMLDFVPNHMAAHPDNPYWRDVLRQGDASPFFRYFDLLPAEKIRLPVLEKDFDTLAGEGLCRLDTAPDGKVIRYGDSGFPLNPASQALPENADIRDVHARQYYALTDWHAGDCGYRRFFNIVSLVGLRMEDREVFEAVHRPLFDLLGRYPLIDGLRIDHLDGLADPAQYLEWLAEAGRDVWVEKILARGEVLPEGWKTCGTTGYEFIDAMNLLFVDAAGSAVIQHWWRAAVAPPWRDAGDCIFQSKLEVLDQLFSPEVRRLAQSLAPETRDLAAAEDFISRITAALPVYRTYADNPPSEIVLRGALQRSGMEQRDFFSALLAESDFTTRWRQLSGAAAAKGLEDCAHYRYTPLAAFNEVGCALPDTEIREYRPDPRNLSLNASTTHDTKRSEDVRARLTALCDAPERWFSFCSAAMKLGDGIPTSAAYFFLQAVAGTWPLEGEPDEDYRDRLRLYMQKAVREESLHTSWLAPDQAYEARLEDFVDRLLAHPDFLSQVSALMLWLAPAGAINALAAQALKILMPGIPDIYQGTELWDYSLVDPDNRRPVDYQERRRLLDEIANEKDAPRLVRRLAAQWRDGAIKLWLTRRLLSVRRNYFPAAGDIRSALPLPVSGERGRDLYACRLDLRNAQLVVAVPLHAGRLADAGPVLRIRSGIWKDTRIGLGTTMRVYTCLLTGKEFSATDAADPDALFRDLPLAVLLAERQA
jgi:(1->4)-alpha-D-glucan 1-alpha-D-glucosylmutase